MGAPRDPAAFLERARVPPGCAWLLGDALEGHLGLHLALLEPSRDGFVSENWLPKLEISFRKGEKLFRRRRSHVKADKNKIPKAKFLLGNECFFINLALRTVSPCYWGAWSDPQ